MIFLNNVGVKSTLCSFRLVLEREADKGIPELLEKISANNFALSESKSDTSGPLSTRCSRCCRFTIVERTISNLWKIERAIDRFIYFITINKFGIFENHFAMI